MLLTRLAVVEQKLDRVLAFLDPQETTERDSSQHTSTSWNA
jgi:hypothetical protein